MEFEYDKLQVKSSPSGDEGAFEFEKAVQVNPSISAGSFEYQEIIPALQGVKETLITRIITFGNGIYFGTGHTFGEVVYIEPHKDDLLYSYLPTAFKPDEGEGEFEFNQFGNLKGTSPVEGDFKFRRAD